MIALALARADVADYVSALFLVYSILILLNILIGWIPRIPFYSRWFRAVLDFITETTDPYLNVFRRLVPSLGGGGMAFASPGDRADRPLRGRGRGRRPDPRVSDRAERGVALRAWGAGALCALVVLLDQVAKAWSRTTSCRERRWTSSAPSGSPSPTTRGSRSASPAAATPR